MFGETAYVLVVLCRYRAAAFAKLESACLTFLGYGSKPGFAIVTGMVQIKVGYGPSELAQLKNCPKFRHTHNAHEPRTRLDNPQLNTAAALIARRPACFYGCSGGSSSERSPHALAG